MSSLPRMIALVRLAYHEAGEIVLADFVGMTIDRASLLPAPTREIASVKHPNRHTTIRQRLIVLSAGGVAERLLCEERRWAIDGDTAAITRAARDEAKLTHAMTRLAERHRAYELGEAMQKAENVLRIRWGRVQQLAEVLTLQGELTPGQVFAILNT